MAQGQNFVFSPLLVIENTDSSLNIAIICFIIVNNSNRPKFLLVED